MFFVDSFYFIDIMCVYATNMSSTVSFPLVGEGNAIASSEIFCLVLYFADTKQYPAFVGHKPGRNNTQRHKLDIQLIMIMNRTLYVAAR